MYFKFSNNQLGDRREKRQVEGDGRIGGFGRGVGRLDVSLGVHPVILADMQPQPPPDLPPMDLNSLNDREVPRADPSDSPPRGNADQRDSSDKSQGESEHKGPAQMQAEDKGHDCTLIVLEVKTM